MEAIRQGLAGHPPRMPGSKTVGRERRNARLFFMPALLALSWPTPLLAQDATPDETLRRQQEREQAIQERELLQANAHMSVSMRERVRLRERESLCFNIQNQAWQLTGQCA